MRVNLRREATTDQEPTTMADPKNPNQDQPRQPGRDDSQAGGGRDDMGNKQPSRPGDDQSRSNPGR